MKPRAFTFASFSFYFLLLILWIMGRYALADRETSRKTLEQMGYTEVHLGSVEILTCGSYASCIGFNAYSPGGKVKVKGAVGCGFLFKGCDIKITP